MPLMSGGDAVVRSILGQGISTIYCLPGVQSDHLFNAMFDAGDALSVVHTRHEQGAAYMALGAALAPDQLGILRKLTKWAERVNAPKDAPAIVGSALKELR